MQAAIDRVIQTYGMMVNLTSEEQQATRRKLEKHLAGMHADDAALEVEGLRYLRGSERPYRAPRDRRSAAEPVKAEADRVAANVLPIIREAQKAGATSLTEIAAALDARGVPTARGGRWQAKSGANILE